MEMAKSLLKVILVGVWWLSQTRASPQMVDPGSKEWLEVTPESQGVDSRPLVEALQYIRTNKLPIHSLLIIRHRYLVLDAYFYPFQKGELHDVASVTKSITSAVVGAAIDQGVIKGVQQPIMQLLLGVQAGNPDPRKRLITVKDLLTMTSGLDCGFQSSEIELSKMRRSDDWATFALSLPMRYDPGVKFSYCSCNPYLLSAAISAQTRRSEFQFAREHIFEPLGITTAIWPSDPKGRTDGWGDLHLLPRDMAKVGFLFLNRGIWKDKPIISSRWVEESLKARFQTRPGMGYGYGWWVNENMRPAGFEAAGRGGQQISILPAYDAVIVFTGGGFDAGQIAPFLLRSLTKAQPLPENKAANEALRQQIRWASQALSVDAHEGLRPKIAQTISNRLYTFPENLVQLRSFRMQFYSTAEAQAEISLGGQKLKFKIGLDGRGRMSNGSFELPIEAKGQWVSEHEFVLDVDTVANINHLIFNMTFQNARMRVTLNEVTGEVRDLRVEGTSI